MNINPILIDDCLWVCYFMVPAGKQDHLYYADSFMFDLLCLQINNCVAIADIHSLPFSSLLKLHL